MQIVRFSDQQDDRPRLGLMLANGIADLSHQAPDLPDETSALLAAGSPARERLEVVAERSQVDLALDQTLTLHAPVRPRKCLAIGLNYRDHAAEMGAPPPAHPIVFSKQVTAIQAPYGVIHLPRVSQQLDYEGELVCVIGRRCRHVPVARAAEVIGGYCVGNDVSVRDWQLRTGQFTMGKSFDTHAPVGPGVTLAATLPDPHRLQITTRVNGEMRQQSSTDQLIFDCFELVSHLSQAFTLEPGDLIFTGTPAGVGASMTPSGFLRAGDEVEVAIEGLGSIRNRVVPEPSETAFID